LSDVNLYDFKSLTQAKADDEDPLFGDIANEGAALRISSNDGTRIEFARNK
jgi:tRNA 2-thiocytidine biosynthesis protein TtcA